VLLLQDPNNVRSTTTMIPHRHPFGCALLHSHSTTDYDSLTVIKESLARLSSQNPPTSSSSLLSFFFFFFFPLLLEKKKKEG
jgi:hypothetical protein